MDKTQDKMCLIKKIKLIFFIMVNHLAFNTCLFAQEICNNGIDDDGNGLVDCYDTACTVNPPCSNFFYGKPPASCYGVPAGSFSMNLLWQSAVS